MIYDRVSYSLIGETGVEEGAVSGDPRLGVSVTHRRYVPHSHAHYAGDLVDGAYALGLFGDVATELCIRTDGDEGLFAGYADIRFTAPIRAGDVVEVRLRDPRRAAQPHHRAELRGGVPGPAGPVAVGRRGARPAGGRGDRHRHRRGAVTGRRGQLRSAF